MSKHKVKLLAALVLSLTMVVMLIPATAARAQYTNDYALYNQYYELDAELYIDFYDLDIIDAFDFETYISLIQDDNLRAEMLEHQHRMVVQVSAVEAYNRMMEQFLTTVDGNLQLVYPDDYAGAYVDYDTLVIQLTCISDESIAFYRRLVGRDAPVVFKQVEHSFNQLIAFGEMFVEAIDVPLVSFGFDTMNNAYRITLDQNYAGSMAVMESFSATARFMPVPLIIYLCEPSEEQALTGGSGITTPHVNGDFSVGLAGRRSGNVNALLTTGHAFRRFNNVASGTVPVFRGSQLIGHLDMFRVETYSSGWPNTANGDWAVIHLNSTGSAMMTNQTRTGERMQAWAPTAPAGATVRGIGVHSIWQATVTDVNQSVVSRGADGIYRQSHGITRARFVGAAVSQGGDSGGTIFMSGGINTFVGVHASRTSTHTYFSPLAWVPNFAPLTS